MIKLESIITNEEKNNKKPLTLFLESNRFNIIYSPIKKDLENIFYILSGFNNPKLGHVIYDDFSLNDMSLKQKTNFIKNNLEIISPFSNNDKNMTVFQLIKRHMIFCNLLNKNYENVISSSLEDFELINLSKNKIKDLTNNQLIKLYVLIASLKKPSYVLLYEFEKYLFGEDALNLLWNFIEDKFNKDTTFIFFTNQRVFNKDKSLFFDDKKLYVIDLSIEIKNEKNILIVRENFYKFKNKISTNFIRVFWEIFKYNKLPLIILFILNILFFILFFISSLVYQNNVSNVTDVSPTAINNMLITVNVLLIIFLSIINVFFIFFILYQNLNLIFKMTRTGQHIIKVCIIYLFVYFIFFYTSFGLSLIYPLIYFGIVDLSISSIIRLFVVPVLIFLFSSILFSVAYIFKNRKLLRKNNDFI